MTCEHLAALENALIDGGARETDRGQLWGTNCREWVYFAVTLDIPALHGVGSGARHAFITATCAA